MTTAIPPQPAGEQEPRGSTYPLGEGATPADADTFTPTPAPQSPYVQRPEQADDRNRLLGEPHSLLRSGSSEEVPSLPRTTPTLAVGRAAVAPATEEVTPAKPLLSRRGFLGLIGGTAAVVMGGSAWALSKSDRRDNQANSTPNAVASTPSKIEVAFPPAGNIKPLEILPTDKVFTVHEGMDPTTGQPYETKLVYPRDPKVTSPDASAQSIIALKQYYEATQDEAVAQALLDILAPDFDSIRQALGNGRRFAQSVLATNKRTYGDQYMAIRYVDTARHPVSFAFDGTVDANRPPDQNIAASGPLLLAYFKASSPTDPGSTLRAVWDVATFKFAVSPALGFYPFNPRLTNINVPDGTLVNLANR